MLYQLPGMRDVAFEIIRYHYFPESSKPHKLKVAWWDIGRSHPPYPMGLTQNIKLTDGQWVTRTVTRPRGLNIGDEKEKILTVI